MPYASIGQIASDDRLHLRERPSDREALLRVVRQRLAELVTEPPDLEERYLLEEARKFLTRASSTELELLPSQAVELMSSAVEALAKATEAVSGAQPSFEERLVRQENVAVTRAQSDFRTSRTVPLAGISLAAVFAWFSDAAELTTIEPAALLGSVAVGGVSAVTWLASSFAQRRDERVLHGLYDPEVQQRALDRVLSEGVELRGDTGPRSDALFSRADYERALRQAVGGFWQPTLSPSKVDLARAGTEAATMAVDRFVALGWIESVRVGRTREMFREVALEGSRTEPTDET